MFKRISVVELKEGVDLAQEKGVLFLAASDDEVSAALIAIPEPVRGEAINMLMALDAQWRQSAPLTRPPVQLPAVQLPAVQPPAVQPVAGPPADPDLDRVLERYPEMRKFVLEVTQHLEASGARLRVTETDGGDVRHYFRRWNFSVIRLRHGFIHLFLRVGTGKVKDDDFKYNSGNGNSPAMGVVRLDADKPIPPKVLKWIEMAQTYTKSIE